MPPRNQLRVLLLAVVPGVLSCQGIHLDGLEAYGGPDETEVSVMVEDTVVDSAAPNQWLGRDAALRVGPGVHTLVRTTETRATVAGLVPSGSEIRQVILRARSSSSACASAGTGIRVHRMRRSWLEESATWNCRVDTIPENGARNCTPANSWQMSLGLGVPSTTPYDPEPLSGPTSCDDGVYELDVTEDVIAWLEGTVPEHPGWLLAMNPGSDTLHSTEAIDFADRPEFLIRTVPGTGVYVLPHPTPTAIDGSTVTHVWGAYRYLIEQRNQWPVSVSDIDPDRVAIIRGRVIRRPTSTEPEGLPGIRVIPVGRTDDLGTTRTHDDGTFELLVHGGGSILLRFEGQDGLDVLLPSQRHIHVPWGSERVLPDVALVPEPETCQRVDSSAGMMTSAVSSGSDDRGDRSLRIYVPPGAGVRDGAGPVRPTYYLCGTEYSIDPPGTLENVDAVRGEAAMPGELPDTSTFTFAAKVQVRTDTGNAPGANMVSPVFDAPGVTFWLDEFLGFPVGTVIPYGYYDESSARWVPGPDGRVVSVTRTSATTCTFDGATIDPVEGAAACSVLDLATGESGRYWRVAGARRFSPIDLNLLALIEFFQPLINLTTAAFDAFCSMGSIIRCDDQSLTEILPIAGSPLSLAYSSNRQRGRRDAFRAAVRPLDRFPATDTALQDVVVELEIAGVRSRVPRPPGTLGPGLEWEAEWGGLDAEDRRRQGPQQGFIHVGYVYDRYRLASGGGSSFGERRGMFQLDGAPPSLPPGRFFTIWQTFPVVLGVVDDGLGGVGGWNVDQHHTYDPAGRTLWMGTGRRVRREATGEIIHTLRAARQSPVALSTVGWDIRGVASDDEGTVYAAVANATSTGLVAGVYRVRRGEALPNPMRPTSGTPAGAMELLCSAGTPRTMDVDGIAVRYNGAGREPTVYFSAAGTNGHCVRRLSTFGGLCAAATPILGQCGARDSVTTVTNDLASRGPADVWAADVPTTVGLAAPNPIALTSSGELLVGDPVRSRVLLWREDDTADGRVELFAGDTGTGCDVDVLRCLTVADVTAIATSPDGQVLIAGDIEDPTGAGSGPVAPRIIGITGAGLVTSVIGGALGSLRGEGLAGPNVSLGRVTGMAVTRDFEIVFSEDDGDYRSKTLALRPCADRQPTSGCGSRVRIVDVQRRMTTLAGCRVGQYCEPTVGAPEGVQAAANRVQHDPWGVTVPPSGEVVFADAGGAGGMLRVVEPLFEGGRARRHYIPSDDGREMWEFDPNGRHLRTLDAFTERELLRFDYGFDGRVSAVRVEDRPPITINYGRPRISIDAWGTSTTLLADGEYSADVQYARDGGFETYQLTMRAFSGLLDNLYAPRPGSDPSGFWYDRDGRLELDRRGANIQTLEPSIESTPGGRRTAFAVELTDGDGFATSYHTHLDARNPRQEVRRPSGVTLEMRRPPDGAETLTTLFSRSDELPCSVDADCPAALFCDTTVTDGRCAHYQVQQRIVIDPRPEFGGQVRFPTSSTMRFRDPLAPATASALSWPTTTTVQTTSSACVPRGDRCVLSTFTSGSENAGFSLQDYSRPARLRLPPLPPIPAVPAAVYAVSPSEAAYLRDPLMRANPHPERRVVRTIMDSAGRATRVERPGQHPICVTYATPRGSEPTRVWQSVDCATGGVTRETNWTYHPTRLVASETAGPVGATGSLTTGFAYDGRGWPDVTTLPGSARQLASRFDANGNLERVTVPGGRVHRYSYTPRDELESETPPATTTLGAWPAAGLSTASYTPAGRPLSEDIRVTAPGENPLTWHYLESADGDFRLDELTSGTSLAYDIEQDHGGRISRIDGLGVNLSRDYAGPYLRREAWVTGARTGSVVTTVAPTQMLDMHVVRFDTTPASTIDYGYNPDRELTSLAISTPGGLSQTTAVTYSAEPSMQLRSATTAPSGTSLTVASTFSGFGELSDRTAMFGAALRHQVRIPDRIVGCGVTQSGRDELGRIRFQEETIQTGPSTSVTTCDFFVYDGASRLGYWRRWDRGCSDRCRASTLAEQFYSYDSNGNRTGGDFQSNEQDQPSRTSRPRAYDERGRLRTRGGAAGETFSHDAFDRLTSVRAAAGAPRPDSLAYDGMGRLVSVQNRDGTSERYLYRDGLRPIAWQRIDPGLSAPRTVYFGYATQQHVPDLAWVDTDTDGDIDVTYRLLTDERGSVRSVVNAATGAIAQTISYDPWGVATSSTTGWEQPFGFAGGVRLSGPVLWHFAMRDYDPTLGRFTTRDPIGLAGGTNVYMYAGGDPVNVIDPSGLFPVVAYLAVGCLANMFMNGGNIYEVGFAIALNLMFGIIEGAASLPRVGRGPGGCFSEDTPVQTDRGMLDISEIEPGDQVWSLEESTGEWAYRAVTERTVHASDGVFALSVGPDDGPQETIEATAEHPFWARPGWTPAGELRPGDEIFTSTGGWIRVHGNTWIAREQLVYNLDVEGADTFFVGESGAWVHNDCIVRHHIFPQEFRGRFQAAGINIDDFTVGLPSGYHTGVVHSGPGPGGIYNQWWRDWFAANPTANGDAMMQFGNDLFWENFAAIGSYFGPYR